jgi:hypothetical protein
MAIAPKTGRLVISKVVDGVAEGPLHPRTDRVRRRQDGTGPLKSNEEKIRMKKYVKPSLKSLGLLRVVTQFSCDHHNPGYVYWTRG